MIKKLLLTLSLLFIISTPTFAAGGGSEFNLTAVIEHHLVDEPIFPWNIGGQIVYEGDPNFKADKYSFKDASHKKYHYVGGIDLHITKRVTMMWIVVAFLLGILIPVSKTIATNPYRINSKFANAIETILEFLKKDVIEPNMHGHGHGYYHYLFSLFFFILFCNLFGLIPPLGGIIDLFIGGHGHSMPALIWSGITVTGDISVTATLALLTLAIMLGTGFMYQGPLYIRNVVPDGISPLLYPLLWPLEFIVSPVAKSFALTMRLLANMTAGHVIMLALMGFIFQFQSYFVVPLSIAGSVAMYMLELFVAFLQAFVFTLLTSLFVGLTMHRH